MIYLCITNDKRGITSMVVLIVGEQYVLIYHMWSLIKYSNTLNNVGWDTLYERSVTQ